MIDGLSQGVRGRMISEVWTDSREMLVLVGTEREIEQMAASLSISSDRFVRVSPARMAVALWGSDLQSYSALHPRSSEGQVSDQHLVPNGAL